MIQAHLLHAVRHGHPGISADQPVRVSHSASLVQSGRLFCTEEEAVHWRLQGAAMRRGGPSFCLFLLLTATAAAQRPAQSGRALVGDALQARIHQSFDRGPADSTMQLRGMEIVLNPGTARRAALVQFVAAQQDPRSTHFHQWLSPEQFAQRFGASAESAKQVADWLRSAGMSEVQVARGRQFIRFSATAATVEAAFHTSIHTYAVQGKAHYANTGPPSIPAVMGSLVAGVVGLDDFNPVPQHIPALPAAVQSTAGSSTYALGPDDLAILYNMQALYAEGTRGSAATLAVVGQSPITLSDYRLYRQRFNLAPNDFTTVATPNSGNGTGAEEDTEEATLDLEIAGGVARDAHLVYVWGASVMDAVQYAVDNDLAQVLSMSYAGCENPGALYYQDIALQANAEGMTWVVASGDSGAAGCDAMSSPAASNGLAVTSPASVPQVTAVGGTALASASSEYWGASGSAAPGEALSYIPETGWGSTAVVLGGGGGVSRVFAKAGYQSDFDTGTLSGRMLPDVSFAAAPAPVPYAFVYNGSSQFVGGTSASAPLFAGVVALVNDYLLRTGSIAQAGLGNVNPRLYLLAEKNPGIFHDVVNGSNSVPCLTGTADCPAGVLAWPAHAGYDEATGLGSVDADALATNWLSVSPGTASVTLAAATAQVQAEQSVSLTARASSDTGSIGSSPVTFYSTNAQAQSTVQSLGTAFTDGDGNAVLATALLPQGSNRVTAVFNGSTTVAGGAVSNVVPIAVAPFATTTALSATASSYHAGQMATFAITVSGPSGTTLGGPDPTDAHYDPGTVTLYAADGTTQAQAPVFANGSATLTGNALAAGDNTFYAAYSGNSYAAPSRSAELTLPVAAQAGAATSTAISASAAQVSFGSSITLTARVAAQSGSTVPDGSVTFYNGSVALANVPLQGGVACLTLVPSIGSDSITAVYSGSTAFNSSTSSLLTLTVGPIITGDFAITGPAAATVVPGSNASVTLSLTPLDGFAGAIVLSCQGLPSGYACTLPTVVTPQGCTPVTLTIAPTSAVTRAGVPLIFLVLVWMAAALRRRKVLLGSVVAVLLACVPGCGKQAMISTTTGSSTQPASATYVVSVSATSGSITHLLQMNVTIEP